MRGGGTFRFAGTCGTATERLRVGGQWPFSASHVTALGLGIAE